MPLKDLNEQQKEAVTFGKSPLLIVAGAGTGKTTVITERIAWLTEQNLAKTDEILALTFTDKTAGEMEERVDRMMPYGYTDLWIMTFHAFCERILKNHGLDIGIPNDFKLLNQTEQWLLVRQNLEKFNLDYYRPLGNPTKFIHALVKHFSRCKDEEIWPADYLEYAEKLKINQDSMEATGGSIGQYEEIANAYHTYQQLLLDSESLDFGDLINYALKLFRTRPHILKKYRTQFKYILVDEFQDTNFSQYELIKLLTGDDKNLTVVGDDDQSIYKFRGASVSNILQFKNDFPESKEIYLTKNYRSTQNILDLAYNFIQLNNPERLEVKLAETQKHLNTKTLSKKLTSQTDQIGIIEHLHFTTETEEVTGVVNKILELYNQNDKNHQSLSWNDFAILIRANNQAEPFLNGLRQAEIPFNFVASRGLYQKEIILDIFAYLKLLDNYHESLALWRILNLPMVKIKHENLLEISRYANRKAYSLFEAVKEIGILQKIEPETIRKVNKILSLLESHATLAKEKTVKTVVLKFLEDFGYNQYLLQKNDVFSFSLINQLGQKIDDFQKSFDDKSVKNFINLIELELEAGEEGSLSKEMEEGPEAVKIMTIHAAKGLEFKYVFIVNMVDKRFPSINRGEPIEIPDELVKEIIPSGDIHLQEERRLFYVAITRAKYGLYLTSAEDYGGTRKKKLSRFLYETGFTENTKNIKAQKAQDSLKHKNIKALKQDDKNIKKPVTNNQSPITFSYSSLKSFDTCPYQYYLAYVAKVPVPGKATFSYGKTMHATLQKFFSLIKESKNSLQSELFTENIKTQKVQQTFPSIDVLLKFYQESWIDDWYESKTQKEDYKKQGEKSLKKLYEQLTQEGAPKIFALEKSFNFKLNNYTIKGVIDRIDQKQSGLILLDYKTGSAKTEKTAEKDQLLIYQMATEKTFSEPVIKLSFYYLNDNSQISFLGTPEELLKMQEKILMLIKKICADDFIATPEKNKCQYCDFRNICQYRV
ncbi:hypothetical protein COU23_02180 [Candidatus Kuenenbacteria bacterium CG10_big_fil_rev_8_21_14_0_10_36_11]|uniref:DNA 3'-5' helicase n=1 Tax=Candidatus Kuenenbacteria bacterium CG10_big_fil_rev_8_21_14_0_10_36_11 TaxID=1974618 RepID=A0A2M6WAD3_9BACT|nr:MAG: hypothetical protein COU23_02180 [Candidatus Kuenenbacteria bacterium CG10_big_fil_rev_8_21_14_0_10_36_11]